MKVLEKILEEIDSIYVDDIAGFGVECNLKERTNLPCDYNCYECIKDVCKAIICKHMNNGKDTDIPSNDGCIPCGERLPEDGAYQSTIGKIACDIVISALEKQIPKKPNRTTDGLEIRYTDSYRCPNCSKGFAGTGIAKFCYHCGQRLDWSEAD